MPIANYLTLSRILLGPVFLLIYMSYENDLSTLYLLFAVLALSEFTDLIDGILARRFEQVTDLGKILDPMADSIFRLSVFMTFTLPPVQLPLWVIFIIFYRESIVSTLRTLCAMRGYALAARSSGKIKAILLGLASLAILVFLYLHTEGRITAEELQTYSFYCALIGALYGAVSGVEYLYYNRRYLSMALNPK